MHWGLGCAEKRTENSQNEAAGYESESDLKEIPKITTTKFLPPEIKEDEEVSKVTPPQPTNTQKKIIHTADIRCKVEDLKKVESTIKARVQAMGGYISNEN